MNPNQLQFFLAMLKGECQHTWALSPFVVLTATPGRHRSCQLCGRVEIKYGDADWEECFESRGTGQVYLLDGVREDCKAYHTIGVNPDRPRLSCAEVDCLGWQLTEDVWNWFTAIGKQPLLENPLQTPSTTIPMHALDGPEAFYAALSEALTPLAINAQEAEEWVRENILTEPVP